MFMWKFVLRKGNYDVIFISNNVNYFLVQRKMSAKSNVTWVRNSIQFALSNVFGCVTSSPYTVSLL